MFLPSFPLHSWHSDLSLARLRYEIASGSHLQIPQSLREVERFSCSFVSLSYPNISQKASADFPS